MRTRWLLAILAVGACERPAAEPGPEPDVAAPADTVRWSVREPDAPRFRAHAWGAGDTLWGTARGRLSWLLADGTTGSEGVVAWGVHTAPAAGIVSWTNEQGLWLRQAGARRLAVTPGDAPEPGATGPEVLWSPAGTRAILTWTAESPLPWTLLERDRIRTVAARLPGYLPGSPLLWLDEERALLHVTAMGPRSGQPEYREAGWRGDIAVLELTDESLRKLTDAADGEFHVIEGMADGNVLVGIRTVESFSERHALLDPGTGTTTPSSLPAGHAAAAHGYVALLVPEEADGWEQTWSLHAGRIGGPLAPLARVQAHAPRLIWHPARPLLAVAVESEGPDGVRTILVEPERSLPP